MGRFVIARLVTSVFLFFAVTLFVFIVFFVIPQPRVKGPGRGGNADEVDIRDSIHLQGSMFQQYGQFVYGFVRHGYLGRSYANRQQVSDDHLPRRACDAFGRLRRRHLLAPARVSDRDHVGAYAPLALRQSGDGVRADRGLGAPRVARAHPRLRARLSPPVFPFTGYCEFFTPTTVCGGPTQWVYHLLLPWFVFSLLYAAMYARMIRASTLETLNEEFVRTARAKGASDIRSCAHTCCATRCCRS